MASFGENLRRERELRGISLRDVADATKISLRFLQAIEQDRIDVLPGGIFPRAFVRQYARQLGLDAERIVAEFLYIHGNQSTPQPPPAPAPRAPRYGAWVATALILMAASVWLLRPGSPPEPSAEPIVQLPPPRTLPVEPVYPSPASAERMVEHDGLTLTLRAQQSCWVGVEVDGETVLNRVLDEGETQTIEAEAEIVLSVGNAGGLSFTINDRPGMPLGRSGEVRRNIVINTGSLPSLLVEPRKDAQSS
jgi:hypothetical protein